MAGALAKRIGRYLERHGLMTRDMENSYLVEEGRDDGVPEHFVGSSITYRIAVGSHKGRRVFRLQTLPLQGDWSEGELGKVDGFSLHAGVSARRSERKKPVCLCRYISCPAVSEKRLSVTEKGYVRYELKTPYRDGTTQVIFEPLDFIARLAALVPGPRENLTRYHGVFAPNSRYRAQGTPGNRGRRECNEGSEPPAGPTHRGSMS